MPESNRCPQCGTPLPAGALAGLCPACLLKLGASEDTVTDAKQGAFTPPSVAELAVKFPQLEILELIGKGGMGAVYKARQRQLDRIVALKILPPGIGDDPAFAERFAREAKALAKLNHPGIVTIYDFGRADGLFYFFMEFVDGVNLRQLLHAGRISAREALAIVPQICDALQFAHDLGIVHRDIKPENILLDRRGRVKVADFGLVKIMGGQGDEPAASGQAAAGSTALTDAGKMMGTPQYMSPEQIQAPGAVDHRADIYALGVVFYQMLTGELPGKKLEPPSRKVSIDVRLDEIVMRALEKQPELRFQQASILKTQVETFAASNDRRRTKTARAQKGIPVLRWRDRWIWDTTNVILMAFPLGLVSIIASSILVPFFGVKGLLALIPGGMGVVFALVYGLVGSSVCKLKAGLPASDAEVAEALIFERPKETPGVAVLHPDRLELLGVAVIGRLVVRLDEIASVSEVRLFNGRTLWWKRGFVLDLKNGRRIGVAVPEPFGRRWRAKLSGGTLPELPATETEKSETEESEAGSQKPEAIQHEKLFIGLGTAIFVFAFFVCLAFALQFPRQATTPLIVMAMSVLGLVVCGIRFAGFWPFPSLLFPEPNFSSRNLSQAGKPETEPHFSRTAIMGAGLVVLAVTLWAGAYFVDGISEAGFGDIYDNMTLVELTSKGLAVLGTLFLVSSCLFGWIAVSQIRHSTGKIYGMWLAVLDGLFAPLLILNSLLMFWLRHNAVGPVLPPAPPFVPRSIPPADMDPLIGGLLILALYLAVNTLVVIRVWRAVGKRTESRLLQPSILKTQGETNTAIEADAPANQSAVNKAEWNNPQNWTSTKWKWPAIYFSKRDSRVLVPKLIPGMGYTVNLGHPRVTLTLFVVIFIALAGGVAAVFKASTSPVKSDHIAQNGVANTSFVSDKTNTGTAKANDSQSASNAGFGQAQIHAEQGQVVVETKQGTLTADSISFSNRTVTVTGKVAVFNPVERAVDVDTADLREARAKLAALRADYADNNLLVGRQQARIKEMERLAKEEPDLPADLTEAKIDLAVLRVDYPDQNLMVQRKLARISALEKIGQDEPNASAGLRAAVAQRAELLVDYPPQNHRVQEVEAEIKTLEHDSSGPNYETSSLAAQPPVVVKTFPVAGARDVPAGETEIRVRFSKPMADNTFGCCSAWDGSLPQFTRLPHFEADRQTCVLKATLEAGHTYGFWFNTEGHMGFRDSENNPAVPYELIFQTKQK